MAITEIDLIHDISPTEAVLLYGDRVVTGHPTTSFDREEVPTSGQGVDGLPLVDAAMETLAAAVIAGGAVPTVEESRAFLLFRSVRLNLHCAATEMSWPTGSPEARLVDWLGRQPGQSAGLREALIALFMPTRQINAWRTAYQSLHDGLVSRGYVERRTVTVLKVVCKEQFAVPTALRAQLTSATPAFERGHLRARSTLRSEVRDAALKSWRAAFSEQNLSIGD